MLNRSDAVAAAQATTASGMRSGWLSTNAASASAGRFLVGDDVSMADCFLVPQLYNARRFNVPLQAYPTLLAVEARCLEVAAFVDSHPDRMPDAVSPAP